MKKIVLNVDDQIFESLNFMSMQSGMPLESLIEEMTKTYKDDFNTLNADTLDALAELDETKKNPSLGKSYDNVDEMMKDLLS